MTHKNTGRVPLTIKDTGRDNYHLDYRGISLPAFHKSYSSFSDLSQHGSDFQYNTSILLANCQKQAIFFFSLKILNIPRFYIFILFLKGRVCLLINWRDFTGWFSDISYSRFLRFWHLSIPPWHSARYTEFFPHSWYRVRAMCSGVTLDRTCPGFRNVNYPLRVQDCSKIHRCTVHDTPNSIYRYHMYLLSSPSLWILHHKCKNITFKYLHESKYININQYRKDIGQGRLGIINTFQVRGGKWYYYYCLLDLRFYIVLKNISFIQWLSVLS